MHLDGIFATKPGGNLIPYLLADGQPGDKGRPCTLETVFSTFIPNEFIHSRSILFGALADGLTLGGSQMHQANKEKGVADYGLFAQKIDKAIENSFNQFNMQ